MLTPSDRATCLYSSVAFLPADLLLGEDVCLQLGCSLKHREAGSAQTVFPSLSLQGRGVPAKDTIFIFT